MTNANDSIKENGHVFVSGASRGFAPASVLYDKRVCAACGIVRRADGKNSECVGAVHVKLRDQ